MALPAHQSVEGEIETRCDLRCKMADCPTQDSASLWLRLSGWAGPIRSDAALQRLREIMGKLKLTVNEEKTRICKVPEGEFDFLGYTFGRMFSARTGQARIGYRPSRKSIQRVVEKVHALTDRSGTWQDHNAGEQSEPHARARRLECGEMTGFRFESEHVCGRPQPLRRGGQTLSPGDRADPGLASVRGLDWLGPNRRREGFVHVHQTHRYAARHPKRCSPAQGSLPRCPADAEGRRGAEGRK